MKWLDLTLPGASGNLACDEALLEACEDSPDAEMLRFWEPRHYFVVLG
jgi:lipoate-protein ligase A